MCPVPHWLTCVSTCSLAGDAVLECCRSFKRWHLAGGSESLGRALRLNSLAPLPINSLLPEQECNVSSHLPSPAATPSRCRHYSHCYQVFQLWWLHFSGILSQKKKKPLLLPQVAFVRKFYHIEEIEKAKKGGGIHSNGISKSIQIIHWK